VRKKVLANCGGLLAFWLVMLSPVTAPAQTGSAEAARLLVGALVAPPFMMKAENGQWEGLSIELWQELAQELAVEFEWREFQTLDEIRSAIARGEIDVMPAMAMTSEHEVIVDFSHPYYRSGSAIAVSATGAEHGWLGVVRRIVSWNVLGMIAFLALLWITAGVALWLCERRSNRELLSEGPLKGVEHGIWWAAVTMTTVGYGDVAPKTIGGRIVATIWMLISIVLIASFTATITTSLTVGALHGKIRGLHDLAGARVGALAGSESLDFLTQRGIAALPIQRVQEGLQAIANDELDAFIFNRAVLAHLARTKFPAHVRVLPDHFDPYYVGVALQSGSELREPIDRALLQIMASDNWSRLVTSYVGTGSHGRR
jgi:polar amino acid transport system substrate-binding protein